MNLVKVSIVKIIEEPKQIAFNGFCGWVIKVVTDCYGNKKEQAFTGLTKQDLEKYKVGYNWME